MRRAAALAVALALAGCAHGGAGSGGSFDLDARPHAALGLNGPTGVEGSQQSMLEDAICQALVEVNHGDVACPSAIRAAVKLARDRAMASGDPNAGASAIADLTLPPQQVQAAVRRDGPRWVLTLSFVDGPAAQPLAQRTLTEASFDDLVLHAPDATKALLQ